MAIVHFAPYSAIKYIGSKAKVFHTSLARPKPKLKKGDIVIVDKKTAFNLVHKGFGEFESIKDISFVKADIQSAARIKELEDNLSDTIDLETHTNSLKEIENKDEVIKDLNKQIQELQEVVSSLKDEKLETKEEASRTEDVNTEDKGK